MTIEVNELSANAMGGTELMLRRLHSSLPAELLDRFQIIPSRVRELDPTRIPILWCHDLPNDPESQHLRNGGYNRFERIVFVSHTQMQAYIELFGIPWYKCVVMLNAIEPIDGVAPRPQRDGEVRLIYHTTPHRGLELLLPAFDDLLREVPNARLSVYSSYRIYGWPERDQQFAELFDRCREHPSIDYHGSVSNAEVRDALANSHVFAYPSIWPETSCLALMEAMSAGLACVHPNLGALYETAACCTHMYQWQNNPRDHVRVFTKRLIGACLDVTTDSFWDNESAAVAGFAREHYNWNRRAEEWRALLESILRGNR